MRTFKWLRVVAVAAVFSVVFGVAALAAVTVNYPQYDASIQVPVFSSVKNTYYVVFHMSTNDLWYCVTSPAKFTVNYDSNFMYFSDSGTSNSWSTYNWYQLQDGSWVDPSSNRLETSSTWMIDTYTANFDVPLYTNNTVQKADFFQSAPKLLMQAVPGIVKTNGGKVSSAVSGTSSIVLVTALIVLAILLGVSLIPRVIHSFL